MLLGGLWHGAGWTFVAWGALHGILLSLNHAWVSLVGEASFTSLLWRRAWVMFCWAVTLLAVIVAWVFFRANSFSGAMAILEGMAGINGAALDHRLALYLSFLQPIVEFTGRGIGTFGSPWGYLFLFALSLISVFPYNSWQIVGYSATPSMHKGANTPLLHASLPLIRRRSLSLLCGATIGLMFVGAILRMTSVNQFLYFTF